MAGGGQPGNQNATDGKRSTRALEAAIAEISTGEEQEYCSRFQFLKNYWKDVLLDGRENKRLDVLKEASDRVEGKATQHVQQQGEIKIITTSDDDAL